MAASVHAVRSDDFNHNYSCLLSPSQKTMRWQSSDDTFSRRMTACCSPDRRGRAIERMVLGNRICLDLRTTKRAAYFSERLGGDPPPSPTTTLLANENAGLGQNCRVVADRRLASTQRRHQVARTDLAFGGHDGHQLDANGIGESAECTRQHDGLLEGQRRWHESREWRDDFLRRRTCARSTWRGLCHRASH